MTDPYKLLGVSPTATDEEIKQAYRELVRKYHPDKYADTDLAELATEKMKEINAAYEEIQTRRKNGQNNASSDSYQSHTENYDGQYEYGSSDAKYNYVRIRSLINEGNLDSAEVMLDNVAEEDRDAQWHFLMGCVLLRRGFYVDAIAHLDHACRLDPTNAEYRTVRDRLKRQSERAEMNHSYETREGCLGSGCDMCASLMCADCCCECMGGDLLRC